MTSNYFDRYFRRLLEKLSKVNNEELESLAELIRICQLRRGKVIIAGNGGSSAMASHVSVDLTKTAEIRAINFNEADLITCFANDFGYENWISKALNFYGEHGDILILISSSGQSMNIINAAKTADQMGIDLITFSGFSSENPLRLMGKLNFWVDSSEYNIVEMIHHIWLLSVVDYLVKLKNLKAI